MEALSVFFGKADLATFCASPPPADCRSAAAVPKLARMQITAPANTPSATKFLILNAFTSCGSGTGPSRNFTGCALSKARTKRTDRIQLKTQEMVHSDANGVG